MVAVGGLGRVTGVFYAAVLIGVLDFVLKKYLPQGGTLFIYALDHPAAAVAAAGPVRRQIGMSGRVYRPSGCSRARQSSPAQALGADPVDPAARLLFRLPAHLGFGTELLTMILFALSLDLALGYAGIVTLGHAAFFGAGAYTVGMLAKHGIWNEPITQPASWRPLVAAAASGWAPACVLLRTTGLTLLMLTLCTMALLEEAANLGCRIYRRLRRTRQPADPAAVRPVRVQSTLSEDAVSLLSRRAVLCFLFVRTLVYSPFGQSLTGIRENTLRMHAVGAPVRWRLVTCYAISAAIAGIAGGLWAQSNAYVNLSTLGLDRAATVLIILVLGGYGRLYGAFIGAVAYLALSHFLAKVYPTAWQLGLGLLLVLIALFARNGIIGLWDRIARRLRVRRAPP